jgi:hypothetical protein
VLTRQDRDAARHDTTQRSPCCCRVFAWGQSVGSCLENGTDATVDGRNTTGRLASPPYRIRDRARPDGRSKDRHNALERRPVFGPLRYGTGTSYRSSREAGTLLT